MWKGQVNRGFRSRFKFVAFRFASSKATLLLKVCILWLSKLRLKHRGLLWFLNHKKTVGVWLLIGFRVICFQNNLNTGRKLRLTRRLRRIHNAWRSQFKLNLVFKVQWFRLGGRRCSPLNAALCAFLISLILCTFPLCVIVVSMHSVIVH